MLNKLRMRQLPIDDWDFLIDQWVSSERDRKIAKLALFDKLTAEQIAEEVDMSARHIYRIVKGIENTLLNHV